MKGSGPSLSQKQNGEAGEIEEIKTGGEVEQGVDWSKLGSYPRAPND
jgi:hypothetical protein